MSRSVFPEPHDEMEMPCPCQRCGNWFDLNDGVGSQKWYPNTVICENCADEEDEEIERDEEVMRLQGEIEDAKWTIEHNTKRLKELGVTIET